MKTWWNLNNPYSYRNENLRIMGFKTYRSYLKSELWKGLRTQVFTRSRGRCERCGKPATQVHHRAYDPATLRGDSLNALTAVCAGCHKKAEYLKPKHGDHLGQMNYQRLQRANTEVLIRKKRRRRTPKKQGLGERTG